MISEPNLALRRSKHTGAKICLLAAVLAGIFIYGVAVGSYWALAIPVAVGVFAVLWLAFWIGWTINTVDVIPQEAEPYDARFARQGGRAICLTSALLALLFVVGVWRESYWALAVPVAVAVLGLLGMVFHIGWAIVGQRTTLPGEHAEGGSEAEGGSTVEAETAPAEGPEPAAS